LLRVRDAKGRTDYKRDEQGNVVKSHLNESLLQEIAGAAKGVYFPLRGAKTVDTLYRDWLAPLPKSDSEEKLIRRPHERYHWPLALGMLLLIVEMLLPERKRESSAKTVGQASRLSAPAAKPAAAAVTAMILLVSLLSGLGSPSGALREYKAGQYDQALKEYERLIERKLISSDELERVIKVQQEQQTPLTRLVVELGFLSEEDLLPVLRDHFELPLISLKDFPPTALAIDLPAGIGDFFKLARMVPVKIEGRELLVATTDPFDVSHLHALELAVGRDAEAFLRGLVSLVLGHATVL